MAYGRLGKAALVATTNTTVYTAPSTCKMVKLSLNFLNPNATAATLQAAISTSDTPAATDYIENGVQLPASGGVLNRSDVIIGRDERLVVQSSLAGVVVRVSGEEIV
jgi:hypothetical protein